MRPTRWSGVVLGSLIMKNENSRMLPDCKRWNGIVIGSPSHIERPITIPLQNRSVANVTSIRSLRCTTNPPRHANRNANVA